MCNNKINGVKLKNELITWVKEAFKKNGRDTAVLGISGGKDSTVCAAILTEALGKDNVIGVLMPNGIQSDINDSKEVVKVLGIKHITVNINQAYKSVIDSLSPLELSEQARINLAPRIRMSTLYAIAQSIKGKTTIVGTGNKSEVYVGYFTKYGDGAHDINPIKNLWVDEVIAVGDALGLPYHLVHKDPSDGLTGKTDEESLGVTYAEIKDFAVHGTSGDVDKDAKIEKLHKNSKHKRNPIPSFEPCI